MEELTDQSEQIKMEDLDELSQLIQMEFNDERKGNCELPNATEQRQAHDDPLMSSIPSCEDGGIEGPMLHSTGIGDIQNTEF